MNETKNLRAVVMAGSGACEVISIPDVDSIRSVVAEIFTKIDQRNGRYVVVKNGTQRICVVRYDDEGVLRWYRPTQQQAAATIPDPTDADFWSKLPNEDTALPDDGYDP